MAHEYARSYLVRTAINNDDRFDVNNFQFNLPQPSYTIDALNELEKTNVDNNEYVIIAGTDITNELRQWKDWDKILAKWHFYIYPRSGYNKGEIHQNIHYFNDAPQFDISSTVIRNAFANGKDIRYYLPHNNYELIKLYKIYGL